MNHKQNAGLPQDADGIDLYYSSVAGDDYIYDLHSDDAFERAEAVEKLPRHDRESIAAMLSVNQREADRKEDGLWPVSCGQHSARRLVGKDALLEQGRFASLGEMTDDTPFGVNATLFEDADGNAVELVVVAKDFSDDTLRAADEYCRQFGLQYSIRPLSNLEIEVVICRRSTEPNLFPGPMQEAYDLYESETEIRPAGIETRTFNGVAYKVEVAEGELSYLKRKAYREVPHFSWREPKITREPVSPPPGVGAPANSPVDTSRMQPAFSPSNLSEPVKNYDTDFDGGKPHRVPLGTDRIREQMFRVTGGWPRRTGSRLFVHDGQGINFLDSSVDLFGFMSRYGNAEWIDRMVGYLPKGEFFSELRRTARNYEAIESHPHFPPIAGHYYAHAPISNGCGVHLQQLLDKFSPASTLDRDLILAMFATAFWGGPGGARPAFVIVGELNETNPKGGRGIGKSTLAKRLGELAGGTFEIEWGGNIDEVEKRLLTPSAASKRIACADNIKSSSLFWPGWERTTTSSYISGRQLHVGEGVRPNLLTWILTINGLASCRDVAQRSVIIELKRPRYSANWEEDAKNFISANKWRIIGDLKAFFLRPQRTLSCYTRWGHWERDVLSRLPDPVAAQKLILKRQSEADSESDEADTIEDYFRRKLEALGYDTDNEKVHIPNELAMLWMAQATGEKVNAKKLNQIMGRAASEGEFKHLRNNPSHKRARGQLWAGAGNEPVLYEIEDRIRENGWRENGRH